ncbi:MAG TPA: high-potential iron-sulfur protein [Burkholderiaceae bacterium]
MQHKRRTFLIDAAGAASALAASRLAFAQPGTPLSATDPMAVALGFTTDATKADKAKFTNWAADHTCSNCQLYLGKPGDASGPCSLFQQKLVSAKGWCSAWAKKA